MANGADVTGVGFDSNCRRPCRPRSRCRTLPPAASARSRRWACWARRPGGAVPVQRQRRWRGARGGVRLTDRTARRGAEAGDPGQVLALGGPGVRAGCDGPRRPVPGLGQVLVQRAGTGHLAHGRTEVDAGARDRGEETAHGGGAQECDQRPGGPVPPLADRCAARRLGVTVADGEAPAGADAAHAAEGWGWRPTPARRRRGGEGQGGAVPLVAEDLSRSRDDRVPNTSHVGGGHARHRGQVPAGAAGGHGRGGEGPGGAVPGLGDRALSAAPDSETERRPDARHRGQGVAARRRRVGLGTTLHAVPFHVSASVPPPEPVFCCRHPRRTRRWCTRRSS